MHFLSLSLSCLIYSLLALSLNASSHFLSYSQIKKKVLFILSHLFSDLVFLCHLHPPLSSHLCPPLISSPFLHHVSSSSAVFSSHFFMSCLSSSPHHPIFFKLFFLILSPPLYFVLSHIFSSCFSHLFMSHRVVLHLLFLLTSRRLLYSHFVHFCSIKVGRQQNLEADSLFC